MADEKISISVRLKDGVSKGLTKVGKGLTKLEKKTLNLSKNWKKFAKIAAVGVASALALIAKTAIKAAAEFEQFEIAFTTMLGSASEAKSLLKDIADFAAKTPFDLPQVTRGAKSLLAFGVTAEDILPTMKSLGDVSAGLSVPMERLILNFGQVKTQGKLTGRELRDFAVAGVPLVSELAKNLNVAEKEIADLVSRGKIGFPEVEKAFATMTGEGGKFANLMTKQAGSAIGKWSNLKDEIGLLAISIGKKLLPATKNIIAAATQGISKLRKKEEERGKSQKDQLKRLRQISAEEAKIRKKEAVFGDDRIERLRELAEEEIEIRNNLQADADERLLANKELFSANMVEEAEARQAARELEAQSTDEFIKSKLQKEKMALATKTANEKFAAKALAEQQKKIDEQKKKDFDSTMGYLAGGMQSKNKELFAIGKAAAVAQAVMSGAQAFNVALASAPPPFNFALAAGVAAIAADKVAQINNTQLQLADGGIIPGSSYSGDNVQANVNSGEMVLNEEQQANLFDQANSGGGNTQVDVYISGKPLAKEMYETQQEMIRTGELEA